MKISTFISTDGYWNSYMLYSSSWTNNLVYWIKDDAVRVKLTTGTHLSYYLSPSVTQESEKYLTIDFVRGKVIGPSRAFIQHYGITGGSSYNTFIDYRGSNTDLETDIVYPEGGTINGLHILVLEKLDTDTDYVFRLYNFRSSFDSNKAIILGTFTIYDTINQSFVYNKNNISDNIPFIKRIIYPNVQEPIWSIPNELVTDKKLIPINTDITKLKSKNKGFYCQQFSDPKVEIDLINHTISTTMTPGGSFLLVSYTGLYYQISGPYSEEFTFVSNGLYFLYAYENHLHLQHYTTYVDSNDKIILGQICLDGNGELLYDAIPFTHIINEKVYKTLVCEDELLPPTASPVPNLVGKKLSIMRDSISTYAGYIPSGNASFFPQTNYDVNNVNLTWWKKLLDNTGMILEVNESWSGSRIATPPEGRTEKSFTNSDRYNNLGNPDIIIVFGGINDEFAQSNPTTPGSFLLSTNGEMDLTTLKQAYQFLVRTLQTTYPTAKLFICSPTFMGTNIFEDNAVGMSQVELHEMVQQIADFYGCGFIDLAKCGINKYNYTHYLDDTVHPNKNGMQLIYEKVLASLREYLI